jgi:hypothetical protein
VGSKPSSIWREAAGRALDETRHAFRLESTERVVVAIAIAAIGLAALWLFAGQHDALGALLGKALVTGAVVLLFPLVYIWKLVTVPARMAAEAAAQVAELQTKANRRDALRRGLDQLGGLLAVARELINAEVTSEEEFRLLVEKTNGWRNQVIECTIANISTAEAHAFDVALARLIHRIAGSGRRR